MTPADLATIYNFNPLFNAGMSGQNQTIYLIEDSDLYSTSDWTTFRSTFGLSGYTGGSLSTVHPAPASGKNNCTAPGVNADDGEAILDAEYASAAAPSAAIVMATCKSSITTFGGLIAIQNLINGANPPAIISLSYGECEASSALPAMRPSMRSFNRASRRGPRSSWPRGTKTRPDAISGTAATHGIGVSGFASTPYNVAVGGTDFSDTYSGTNTTYWNSSNSPRRWLGHILHPGDRRGTTPAPASCLRLSRGYRHHLWRVRLLQQQLG